MHLRAALAPQPVVLYPGTLSYSTPAAALQTFLEPHPVEEWARLLPKRADVVELAALEREGLTRFSGHAGRFNNATKLMAGYS